MNTILHYMKYRYLDEKGQGIVEYALILVFVVIVVSVLIDKSMGIDESVRPFLQWFLMKVLNVIYATEHLLESAL